MRNVMPIVKNAIQDTFPKISIVTASAKNTIPSGRYAVLP